MAMASKIAMIKRTTINSISVNPLLQHGAVWTGIAPRGRLGGNGNVMH